MLVVDVVESVRLIEQDEEGVIARWLASSSTSRPTCLPAGDGRLVKSLGDGMLLEFGDVRAAVSAAFAIQHASSAQNSASPPERQMLLRMGIEISDVIVEAATSTGAASISPPGSRASPARARSWSRRSVRDQLTPILDADVEDLGECYLRHVQSPSAPTASARPARAR